MTKTQITIVGGGACGVAACIELTLQLELSALVKEVSITIIERLPEIGEGLAFGTQQKSHLLNTQAALMGIYAEEPAHYSEWLEEQKAALKEEVKGDHSDLDTSYSTRRLYSDYLKAQFSRCVDHASTIGLAVNIINAEAIDFTPAKDRWEIVLDTGLTVSTDFIILAPGTPKPINYSHLEGTERYFDFPWPTEPIIKKVSPNARVGILGASLSAVDTIMTLIDNNHEGEIILSSPDGLLPRVQLKDEVVYERKHLTLANVHAIKRREYHQPRVMELFRLFKKEVENYVGQPFNWRGSGRIGKSAQRLLEEDIEVAEQGGDAFITVITSLRDEASQMWSWLTKAEKKKFMRWPGTYWSINRYGMPLVNARKLKAQFDKGKLSVVRDLIEVRYQPDSNQFELHADEQKHLVDFVINATGPGTQVEEMKSILLQNLKDAGVIQPYSPGGILIDTETMQVLSRKADTRKVYAVGHICNGLLLDVNSVWFNVRTIAAMCKHMVKAIGLSK